MIRLMGRAYILITTVRYTKESGKTTGSRDMGLKPGQMGPNTTGNIKTV